MSNMSNARLERRIQKAEANMADAERNIALYGREVLTQRVSALNELMYQKEIRAHAILTGGKR